MECTFSGLEASRCAHSWTTPPVEARIRSDTLRRSGTLRMRIALVTGTSGIGESTTGGAVAERTASQGRASAVFDVDELPRLWSTRDGDPFNTGLILRNLASIVEERLRQRHQGAELDGLAWHIDRAPELVAIRDRRLQLPVVDASGLLNGIVDAVLGLLT